MLQGNLALFSWSQKWVCVISGLDYWTGLLDWITGMTFKHKFSHKNVFMVKTEQSVATSFESPKLLQ